MHALLAAAVHAIAPYQMPPDAVPTFKKQRPVLGTPVRIDPAERQRLTLEALSIGYALEAKELWMATGLRPGAQRRTLRALIRQGIVEVWPQKPCRFRECFFRARGRRRVAGRTA